MLLHVRYQQRHPDLCPSFKFFRMFTMLLHISVLFCKSFLNFYHLFSESPSYPYPPAIVLALSGWLPLDFSVLSNWFENHLLFSSHHPKQPSRISASLPHRLFQTSAESSFWFFGCVSTSSLRHRPVIQGFKIFTTQPRFRCKPNCKPNFRLLT